MKSILFLFFVVTAAFLTYRVKFAPRTPIAQEYVRESKWSNGGDNVNKEVFPSLAKCVEDEQSNKDFYCVHK